MSYWQTRQTKGMNALEKSERALKKRLDAIYKAESARLSREITAFYMKHSISDVLQYRTLFQILDEPSRKLLLEDWDAFAKQYPQYSKYLPVRKNIYKLNRLEGLQTSVQLQMMNIAGKTTDEITGHLTKSAETAIKSISNDLYHEYNPELMRKFVNTAWVNGDDFSARIWDNTKKLSDYLTTDIAQGMARGDSYKKLVRNVTERFEKVSRRDAYRLIYTEGTYVYNQATASVVQEDFEKYKISTVGDGKVCDFCHGLDGKTFKFSDMDVGVNFPPFHPWCRCSFEIVIDDRKQWLDDYIAKHKVSRPQAQTVLDRVDTSAKEKASTTTAPKPEITKATTRADLEKWTEGMLKTGKYSKAEVKQFIDSIEREPHIKKLYEKYRTPKYGNSKRIASYYSAKDNEIYYSNNCTVRTAQHEHGHYFDRHIDTSKYNFGEIDKLIEALKVGRRKKTGSLSAHDEAKLEALRSQYKRVSSSDVFLTALRKDRDIVNSLSLNMDNKTFQVMRESECSRGVQDFLSSLNNKQVRYGHDDKYWGRRYKTFTDSGYTEKDFAGVYKGKYSVADEMKVYDAASEAYANITQAVQTGGNDLLYVKKFMPNMLQAWYDIVNNI